MLRSSPLMAKVLAPTLFAVSTAFVAGAAHATLPAQSAMSAEIERELAAELETPEAKQVAEEALQELDKAAQDAADEAAIAGGATPTAGDEPVEVAGIGDAAIVGNKTKKKNADSGRGSRCRTMGGMASWYGPGFQGRKTASGERFNTAALTAAHRTLPFNTNVRVTNKKTGRAVIVRINDRGPYAHGRVIDLSRAAAKTIGIDGVGAVNLETCL